MQNRQNTVKGYFTTLTTLFWAMIASAAIFAGVILFMQSNGDISSETQNTGNLFFIIAAVLILNALMAGQIVYKSRVNKIKELTSLKEKLSQYLSVFIIRMALLQGAALFSIVACLITHDKLFIGGYILIALLQIILVKPTKEKIEFDLELSVEEKMVLNNPNHVL